MSVHWQEMAALYVCASDCATQNTNVCVCSGLVCLHVRLCCLVGGHLEQTSARGRGRVSVPLCVWESVIVLMLMNNLLKCWQFPECTLHILLQTRKVFLQWRVLYWISLYTARLFHLAQCWVCVSVCFSAVHYYLALYLFIYTVHLLVMCAHCTDDTLTREWAGQYSLWSVSGAYVDKILVCSVP